MAQFIVEHSGLIQMLSGVIGIAVGVLTLPLIMRRK